MTDQAEAAYDLARSELVDHVGRLLSVADLRRPDMLLTDVVIITVQRGYVEGGGTSITNMMIPSDTPDPMILGMLGLARQQLLNLDRHDSEDDE